MEILCLILGKSFTVSLIDAIVCKNEESHEEAAVVIYVMALYDEHIQSNNTTKNYDKILQNFCGA